MSRAQFTIALLGSALIALIPLALVAWITSGTWSWSRVRMIDLALVLPMLGAIQLGFERGAGLVMCFLTYWAIAFAALAIHIWRINPEVRRHG